MVPAAEQVTAGVPAPRTGEAPRKTVPQTDPDLTPLVDKYFSKLNFDNPEVYPEPESGDMVFPGRKWLSLCLISRWEGGWR